jgi:hypothetical protein
LVIRVGAGYTIVVDAGGVWSCGRVGCCGLGEHGGGGEEVGEEVDVLEGVGGVFHLCQGRDGYAGQGVTVVGFIEEEVAVDEDGVDFSERAMFSGFEVERTGVGDGAAGRDAAKVMKLGGGEGVVNFPFFGGLTELIFVRFICAMELEILGSHLHKSSRVGVGAGGPIACELFKAGDPLVPGGDIVGLKAEGETVCQNNVEEIVFNMFWEGVGAGPATFFLDSTFGVAKLSFKDEFDGLDFAKVNETIGVDGISDVTLAFDKSYTVLIADFVGGGARQPRNLSFFIESVGSYRIDEGCLVGDFFSFGHFFG